MSAHQRPRSLLRSLRWAAAVAAITLAAATFASTPVLAKVSGPNGRIAFFRVDPHGTSHSYTANPDGSAERLLFGAADNEHPHWSPNGSEIAIEVDSLGGSAVIVNPDTGSYRVLARPDATPNLGCFVWSPDGSRLACASLDNADPSRDGIYTVRSSDGGGLTKVTSSVGIPGDYSPDGKRLSFVGLDGDGQLRIFVLKLNGGGPVAITPQGMPLNDEDGGSWSPSGNLIVFPARPAPDHRKAIWVVGADGSGLHEVPIAGCGGAFADPTSIGCDDPVWSPDGTRIAFTRFSSKTVQKNIYSVNADGSGLVKITSNGLQDFGPDWGPHITAP
jgi:Tol biopolymer transport system component